MKKALMMVFAVVFFVSGIEVFADYNKEVTVKAMKENYAAFTKAKAAAGSGDYFAAADGLMTIARNALMLSVMDPPKGSKEDWESLQKQLARAAFKGIGACGEGTKTAVDAAFSEMGSVQMKGHGTFRG